MANARRRTMFIASSSEASDVAYAVKAQFERRDVEVDIWLESTFDVNQGTLASLLNLSAYYDFAVAVFSRDDVAQVRNQTVHVTRDNVIFEFGLFLGRLGPHRAFFIAEKGVDVFSDWNGITTVQFERRANLDAAVGGACDRVAGELAKLDRMATFTLLPTTSLAVGYYTNFLSKVLEAFRTKDFFEVVERDDHGDEIESTRRQVGIRNRDYVIHVEMPQRLRELESAALRYRVRGYTQVKLSTEFRTFPFFIRTRAADIGESGTLELFDVPTTMLAASRAIRGIFDDGFLAGEGRLELIEEREIANFQETISKIMVYGEDRFIKFQPWQDDE